MTENEANMSIKYAVCVLEAIGNGLTLSNENDREDACVLAIKAIDELQQYRAIGTMEEIKSEHKELIELSRRYLKDTNELIKYQEIGTVEEFKALKEITVTQSDINAFKAYIDDCMDDVAFGNTDWNHSLALALKCMELHKT